MSFRDSYPDYVAIEEHIRRARVERSLAIAHYIADAIEAATTGLRKLARKLGATRAGAVPKWARHQVQPRLGVPALPADN